MINDNENMKSIILLLVVILKLQDLSHMSIRGVILTLENLSF